MSEILAISGIRRTIKERVDGSLIVQIEIDMKYKKAFLSLFPDIDMPVAIAPLIANFEKLQPNHTDDNLDMVTKQKGGELAKWAGILCNDPIFWEWLSIGTKQLGFEISSQTEARNRLIEICGIESRAELDHDKYASEIFRMQVMAKFSEWQDVRMSA